MKAYRIEGKLEAPLALKRDRQSDRSQTVSSIPGTTLRGALLSLLWYFSGCSIWIFPWLLGTAPLEEVPCST